MRERGGPFNIRGKRVYMYIGFPKIRGTIFDPYHYDKEDSLFGNTLGCPSLGEPSYV